MESSCKSIRYPDERRLTSRKFVELHVLFVPNEQWNLKLNRVPVEAIKSFISAGFIRVYPDISLRTLRSELGILLGAERDIDKLSFLKCVGRSLALVKAKQERDLKVKYFAPPYVCTFHFNVKICFILCLQKVFIPLDLFLQKKQINHVFLPQFNILHLVFSKLFLEINGFRTDTAAKASQFCPESFCCCFPARDSWKRSYFDTKKATAPLEVTLRSLRQELEIFYNNILHQLKARDGGGKPRWRARLSSTKNELIIQIMTESHEIDNLRRKVDDAKMRLVTEIKVLKS
uniref:Spermatosis associated 1 n=1 Tax=Oncorhynchus kisutch TaxID=8019 RepID=A0A8C7LCK9_ONCKI